VVQGSNFEVACGSSRFGRFGEHFCQSIRCSAILGLCHITLKKFLELSIYSELDQKDVCCGCLGRL